MKKNNLLSLCALFLVCIACGNVENGEQKKAVAADEAARAKLPKLAPIEVPAGVVGMYVGALPCDECDVRRVRMILDSAGKAEIKEYFIHGTDKIDTLESVAMYKDSVDYLIIRFDDGKRFFTFQKNGTSVTSVTYLNPEGKPYPDDSGMAYRLLRILSKVSK